MCNLYSLDKRPSRDPRLVPREQMIGRAICRYSQGSSPTKWLRSFCNGADGEDVESVLRSLRGCRVRRSSAARRLTNIRNGGSPHWRGWLGKQNRCIVPATSFCEYADTKPRKTPQWYCDQ